MFDTTKLSSLHNISNTQESKSPKKLENLKGNNSSQQTFFTKIKNTNEFLTAVFVSPSMKAV